MSKKLYVSLSSNPGKFGETFFNEAFNRLDINAEYRAIKKDSLGTKEQLLKFIKDSGIQGFSLSMPLKKQIVGFLDKKSLIVEYTKNCNLVRTKNGLSGSNTDYAAFERACKEILDKSKYAIIYGSGAVSDTIFSCLLTHGIKVGVVSRGGCLENTFGADFLINATPIGMDNYPDNVFTESIVSGYNSVFDVVAKNETNLSKLARKLNKKTVVGPTMQFAGACKQLELYIGTICVYDFYSQMLSYMKEKGYNIGI